MKQNKTEQNKAKQNSQLPRKLATERLSWPGPCPVLANRIGFRPSPHCWVGSEMGLLLSSLIFPYRRNIMIQWMPRFLLCKPPSHPRDHDWPAPVLVFIRFLLEQCWPCFSLTNASCFILTSSLLPLACGSLFVVFPQQLAGPYKCGTS